MAANIMMFSYLLNRKSGILNKINRLFNNPTMPPAHSDPLTALYRSRRLSEAVFEAEIKNCIDPKGFNYGSDGWQFLVSAVKKLQEKENKSDAIQNMIQYYNTVTICNSLDIVNAFPEASYYLKSRNSIGLRHRIPWSNKDQDNIVDELQNTCKREGLVKPGSSVLNIFTNLEWIAKNHVDRLAKTYKSIRSNGYDRAIAGSDIDGYVLQRDHEFRYMALSGQHRLAILSVLGHEKIPFKFRVPIVVRGADAEYWPLVKGGIWNRRNALRYFDHLFDFNSKEWANQNGL